ncbi:uncharacterized protein LOC128390810 [Panonychus citri]|uniref:uncharacterized protein LOC128390810 n=1 Tax=Panonychus citri TaxID=50023 RepID=UPI0023076615|nr:uncharacterized protein LOC128390810 [Panonychus citri]
MYVCRTFFTSLKKVCNIKTPNVFMSDDFPGYYAAWCAVFGTPANHLLCTWHVLKNWNKHILSIPDPEARKKIKHDLLSIHRELDQVEFSRLYDFFCKKYKIVKSTVDFVSYLEVNYGSRKQQWALCYRKKLGINTNMHLENFHRNLKHIYMDGKKVKRMDESISALMKLTYGMQYDKLIRQTKGFVPTKLSELRNRHQRALNCTFDFSHDQNDSTKWIIISNSELLNMYTVTIKKKSDCSCLIHCQACDLCISEVSCECFDFMIKGNMCKHIHFIGMKRNETDAMNESNQISLEDDLELEMPSQDIEKAEAHVHLLPTSTNDVKRTLEERKQKMIAEICSLVNSCVSIAELDSLQKFIVPMQPTLSAIRSTAGKTISPSAGSQGSGRNIDQQKRFRNKKRKIVTKTKDLVHDSLARELFSSQFND